MKAYIGIKEVAVDGPIESVLESTPVENPDSLLLC